MRLDNPFDLFLILQVTALAMARAIGMTLFLPFLSRQQTSGMVRTAICLGLSLPTAATLWPGFISAPPGMAALVLIAIKEALLGALLGMLVALPFWTVRGMGTLIDNQRGANAAQQANPALQADATLLGELSERALVAFLIDLGLLQTAFTALAASHAQWPVLEMFPVFDTARQHAVFQALGSCIAQAVLLAGPALLLLLLIELALAISSTAVQGFDVYASAMAVKTLSALLIFALIAVPLFDKVAGDTLQWWQEGVMDTLGLRPLR
ncbi:EscT/YscT/HrcT family type III secretion system export apparatus protein [Roseateles aquatilis]|uniref:EscT/YscT/HrcT family type III secretion system export apparatus protein n=1 Tax=Roseateles aquatilis TaxID=431061 RepID=A0A246JMZ9_9BURK|nr:type III secretion system export apparatus subunit SctT [Roseateles aquatilis]OWQ93559.1 EscT/YscT/HrcT family type III secretion system export apparatus protein [Roseateles aquatilis]